VLRLRVTVYADPATIRGADVTASWKCAQESSAARPFGAHTRANLCPRCSSTAGARSDRIVIFLAASTSYSGVGQKSNSMPTVARHCRVAESNFWFCDWNSSATAPVFFNLSSGTFP